MIRPHPYLVGGAVWVGSLAMTAFALGSPAKTATLRIVYTGNLRGVLEPCGCQSLQSGGLSRRASAFRNLGESNVPTLRVDVGDVLPAIRPSEPMLCFVYKLFKRLDYSAVNIGPFDKQLSMGKVRECAAHTGLQLVGKGLMPQVAQAGGVRVAFIGAGPSSIDAKDELDFDDLRSTVRSIEGKVELVVLLSQLSPAQLLRCAQEVPGIDLILSGRHDPSISSSVRAGRPTVLPTALYGQSAGVAEVHLDANRRVQRVSHFQVRFDTNVPQDESVAKEINEFNLTHLTLNGGLPSLTESQQALSQVTKANSIASLSCEGCHKKAYQVWKGTSHAHAWRTLVDRQADRRAECIGCHTTRQLSLGSFSPGITGVGCVTCHGGDSDHARYPRDPQYITRKPAVSVCVACHKPPEDNRFSYARLLPLVRCTQDRSTGRPSLRVREAHNERR